MPTPLTNDRWGYESSCFVCEQTNQAGLKIPFQLEDDQQTVAATFTLRAEHSGAPSLVHGGLCLAVLDEAQAWAVIAITKKWGLTRTTQATFEGPVFVDHPHRVEARIVADGDSEVSTEATIYDSAGNGVVVATASFVVVGVVDEAQAALGLAEKHHGLLRRPGETDA